MAEKLYVGGSQSVSSAGTRVQLSSSSVPVNSIIIQADSGNTGLIYVGDSSAASANGIILGAEDSLIISGSDRRGSIDQLLPSDIYIDASASSQGVRWLYTKIRY
jgi:hypothetical protein